MKHILIIGSAGIGTAYAQALNNTDMKVVITNSGLMAVPEPIPYPTAPKIPELICKEFKPNPRKRYNRNKYKR